MPNKKRGKRKLQARARRDVRLSYRPLIRETKRAQRAAKSAYGAVPGELENIYEDYTGQSNQIASNLVDQLGQLHGALPSGQLGPAPELSAFNGAYGSAGEAALGSLGSQAQRNISFGASTEAQAAIEKRSALDNLIQQRLQLMQGMPAEIRARVDELREQRLTQQLARSQMRSEEATSKYLMDLIGAELDRDNKRDRKRRNKRNRRRNNN